MSLTLSIDPSLAVPLHRQVYEAVRSAILSGQVRPGARLPATRALAGRLALSRATIAEAYDQLAAEGYIEGRHGSGTFVAPAIQEEMLLPRVEGNPPARTPPPLRLSHWGESVIPCTDLPPSAGTEASYDVDFRPHRIEADLFPWDDWRASVERAISGERGRLLVYPPPAGHAALQEAIATHVARYRAVRCSPEQVLIVNGTQQGLNLLAQLLLDPGDPVAVEDPGYPAARTSLTARGLDVLRVPVDAEGMMVDRLLDRPPMRLVHVTPSHQEPTGATLSLARRLALLDIAERTDALVLEDDYDSEFRYEGRPVESLQGLDRNALVIYAGTFSKSVLPGLRIGYLILPPHLVGPCVAAKTLWDSGTPMLEQAALAEFMRSGHFERHIRRMRRLYRSRRDALLAALATHLGRRVMVGASHGGLNVLVQIDLSLSSEEILSRAAAARIALRSADVYYSTPPAIPTFLLGFAAQPESAMAAGVERLASVLEG